MTEQEQVQVSQADREAAEALRGSPAYALGFYDHTPFVQAFARHRHTATAEAMEAMREAGEALERIALICSNYGEPTLCGDCHDARQVCRVALPRLTAAIAKIEGQQP